MKFRPFLFIIIAAALVYGRSTQFDFVFYDDKDLIIDNAPVLANWANVGNAFLRSIWPSYVSSSHYYRPTELISWIFDFSIGTVHPFIYHLSNLAYHIVASLLFYVMLGSFGTHALWRLPLALIYAIHPALSACISWIPGRNDTLLAIFTFLTFIFTMNALKHGRKRDFTAFGLSMALALFTKESAVVLPLFIFLLTSAFQERTRKFTLLAISGALIVFYAVMRHIASPGVAESIFAGGPFTTLATLVSALPALFVYFGKVFLPFHTAVMPTFTMLDFSLGVIAVACIARLISLNPEKNPSKILFSVSLFGVFLLPSLLREPTVKFSEFLLLEHRLAVPLAGALMLIPQCFPVEKILDQEGLFRRGMAVVLIVFGFTALIAQGPYRDRLSFWQASARSNELAASRLHLADMHYYSQNYPEAQKWYEEALKMNPDEYMLNNNRGVLHMTLGELGPAKERFEKELSKYPGNSRALANLAILANRQGNLAEAEQRYLMVLSMYPDYIDAYRQLTLLYIRMKKPAEAERTLYALKIRGDQIPVEIFQQVEALKKLRP